MSYTMLPKRVSCDSNTTLTGDAASVTTITPPPIDLDQRASLSIYEDCLEASDVVQNKTVSSYKSASSKMYLDCNVSSPGPCLERVQIGMNISMANADAESLTKVPRRAVVTVKRKLADFDGTMNIIADDPKELKVLFRSDRQRPVISPHKTIDAQKHQEQQEFKERLKFEEHYSRDHSQSKKSDKKPVPRLKKTTQKPEPKGKFEPKMIPKEERDKLIQRLVDGRIGAVSEEFEPVRLKIKPGWNPYENVSVKRQPDMYSNPIVQKQLHPLYDVVFKEQKEEFAKRTLPRETRLAQTPKNFVCSLCDQKYYIKSQLEAHVLQAHFKKRNVASEKAKNAFEHEFKDLVKEYGKKTNEDKDKRASKDAVKNTTQNTGPNKYTMKDTAKISLQQRAKIGHKCQYCDRIFQLSNTLVMHQITHCLKIPYLERRKIKLSNEESDKKIPLPIFGKVNQTYKDNRTKDVHSKDLYDGAGDRKFVSQNATNVKTARAKTAATQVKRNVNKDEKAARWR